MESDVWWFWNHCRSGRDYPRRPLRKQPSRYRSVRTVTCSICGNEMISYSSIRTGHHMLLAGNAKTWICNDCRLSEIERIRSSEFREHRRQSEVMILKFKDRLSQCEKFGTCDILSAHHDVLKDDPERLSTEFMIGMICGTEKKNKYVSKRDIIKTDYE